jgi:hypothetical protein
MTLDGRTQKLISKIKNLIIKIRRDESRTDYYSFYALVIENIQDVFDNSDLRLLGSICDTIADFGGAIERRNSLIISTIIKMEKIAQTYAHWRLGYTGKLGIPANDEHRKIRLPSGLSSFNLEIGDASNTLFGRIATTLEETPIILLLFERMKHLLSSNDTILGNLNRKHHYVFDHDYRWILGDEYLEFRESGRIPRHKWDKYK